MGGSSFRVEGNMNRYGVATDPSTGDPVEYQYTRLENDNTLRLLELFPGDYHIHGRIVHVPVGSCQYEALSYLWGDSSDGRHAIIVPLNGSNTYFYVQENLMQALYYLGRRQKKCRIWIDAICINQKDLEEKSRIVPRMFDIYSGASQVLVFLGREQYHSEEVPRAIFAINKSLAMDDQANGFPLLNQTASGSVDWSTFRVFLHSRKWFVRVWVIQEVAAAVRSTVVCGEWEISGSDIFDTLGELARYALPDALADIVDGYDRGVNGALQQLRFMRILGAGITKLRRQPLMTLLKRSRASAATLPCDKIYAVLGMALDSNLPNVDYTESWQATYQRFAIYLIRKGHLSDILLNCFQDENSADLPSWVPNWATPVSEDSDRKKLLVQYHSAGRDTAGYQAGGKGFPSYFLDRENPNILSVHGHQFMVVEQMFSYQSPLASYWDPTQNIFNNPMHILAALETIQEACRPTIADPETLDLTMFKTLLCDQHWRENRPLAPTDWRVFHAFFDKWAWTLDTFDPDHPTKFTPEERPSSGRAKKLVDSLCFYRNHAEELKNISLEEKSLNQEKEVGDFIRKAAFCLRMNICRTSLGAVGMIPYRAKEGDTIAVFPGIPVPFVLHAEEEQTISGGSYKLIGACYFNAVMGGEVADGLRDHGQMIKLR